MVTRMVRHHDQDERQSDAALHWDTRRPVLPKAFAKHGARDLPEKHWLRLIHEESSKTRFEYCEDSENSFGFPTFGKSIIFTGVVVFSVQSILENGLIRGEEGKRQRTRHHLTLLVEIPTKKNPVMITQFFKTLTTTVIGNVTRMQFVG